MEDPGKKIAEPERLDRYKKEYAEFIDIAAHDLDAPLRKLGVLVERATADQPTGREYVQRIHKCLADMRAMVDSLAALSRLGLGADAQTTFNLQAVVTEAWQDIQPMASNKKASITVGMLPDVKGNWAQYRQLFRNLFQNAIIFSRKDISPAIEVQPMTLTEKESAERLNGEGNKYFAVSVRDNGIGFQKEDAETIFRPFVRLNGKSEYEGNGIGLALCKKIMENHQGTIYAESEENAGSLFVLIIPQITT